MSERQKWKMNKNGNNQDFVYDAMWALNEEKQANELWIKYWNIEHSRAGKKETNEVCTFVGVVVLLNEMFELGIKSNAMYAMRNKQDKVENDD